jgi:hypothetical protein
MKQTIIFAAQFKCDDLTHLMYQNLRKVLNHSHLALGPIQISINRRTGCTDYKAKYSTNDHFVQLFLKKETLE